MAEWKPRTRPAVLWDDLTFRREVLDLNLAVDNLALAKAPR